MSDKPTKTTSTLSNGRRAERRLGLLLVAPTLILMLAVTTYPIGYVIWLSLQRYDLRFFDDREFIGLQNYASALTSSYWQEALSVTAFITLVSAATELVLGMAIVMVMYHAIFGRGLIRTVVLIPYDIVMVAAAYSWNYAWTPGTGYLANLFPDGTAPLTEQWPSIFIIIGARIWKTTPFTALLLLAGLALVPDDALKAAELDDAGFWQRFFKITLPLTKPSIVVALLFRTLNAFRVFDNIYTLTKGNNGTGSVSILGYNDLFKAFNLGIGSAISVLTFVCMALITIVFVKGFGATSPSAAADKDKWGVITVRNTDKTPKQRIAWTVDIALVVIYALVLVLWIASLSFKPMTDLHDGHFIPHNWTLDNYRGIFQTSEFTRALFNSIGIGLIITLLAVIAGAMAVYAIARPGFPGKSVILGVSLLIAMFPQVSLVSPLFGIEHKLGLFDTWPDLILPYITFAFPMAIFILPSFFRETPWKPEKAAQMDGTAPFQAFRLVMAPLAIPGIATAVILVFIFAWNDFLLAVSLTSMEVARTTPVAVANFIGSSRFDGPTGSITAAAIVITIPIVIFVVIFQRRIVASLTSGAVKG